MNDKQVIPVLRFMVLKTNLHIHRMPSGAITSFRLDPIEIVANASTRNEAMHQLEDMVKDGGHDTDSYYEIKEVYFTSYQP